MSEVIEGNIEGKLKRREDGKECTSRYWIT
jgi:hypothetical protein